MTTPTPPLHNPDLGMDPETLAELAAVDWHAGHPDQAHLGRRCVCQAPATRGEFAVRLVTGQAQLSTDRDGNAYAVGVTDVDPDAIPLRLLCATAPPEHLGRPIAVFTVYGEEVSDPTTHDPACTNPRCKGSGGYLPRNASLYTPPAMPADEALEVVVRTLREFGIAMSVEVQRRQARERGQGDGHRG